MVRISIAVTTIGIEKPRRTAIDKNDALPCALRERLLVGCSRKYVAWADRAD
jgi:hypothetical protein